jgi:hypothetical protein
LLIVESLIRAQRLGGHPRTQDLAARREEGSADLHRMIDVADACGSDARVVRFSRAKEA